MNHTQDISRMFSLLESLIYVRRKKGKRLRIHSCFLDQTTTNNLNPVKLFLSQDLEKIKKCPEKLEIFTETVDGECSKKLTP